MKKATAITHLNNMEKMQKEIAAFIWWFVDRITRIPLKEDKDKLTLKLQTEYEEVELNVKKNLSDYIYQAAQVGITVEKEWITPAMLMVEIKKHFI